MDAPELDALRERAEAIFARYEVHFSGQPRISRDLGELDKLIAGLDEAIEALGPAGEAGAGLLERARESARLYRGERESIVAAQAGGPDALEVHRLDTWAGFTERRYQRHFAGRSRATRDLGLLAECVAELRALGAGMRALAERHESADLRGAIDRLEGSLGLYLAERGEIVAARGVGLEQQQADLLATLANDQFACYQRHFAGRPRLSRRPALLQRIVDNLEQIADRMQMIERGDTPSGGTNQANIQTVQDRIGRYRRELEAIRGRRAETDFGELVAALGGSANEVFARYREHFAGRSRASRDPALLAGLCDELFHLAKEMDELDRAREDAANAHNLAVVVDTLRLYEREHRLVIEAKGASAG